MFLSFTAVLQVVGMIHAVMFHGPFHYYQCVGCWQHYILL